MLRYYSLIIRSMDDLSGLEKELKKSVLCETNQTQSSTLPELLSEGTSLNMGDFQLNDPVNQEKRSLEMPEILYHQTTLISKERNASLFRDYTPPVISVDIIVSTSPVNVKRFDEYLSNSDIAVRHASNASNATLSFSTQTGDDERRVNYRTMLEAHAKNYSGIKTHFTLDSGFSKLNGIIDGPIKEVLHFKKLIIDEGTDVPIAKIALQFYSC